MGRGKAGIEWDTQVCSELPGERDVCQIGGGASWLVGWGAVSWVQALGFVYIAFTVPVDIQGRIQQAPR